MVAVWVAAIGLVQSFLGQQKAAEQAHAAEVIAREQEQQRVMLMAAGLVGVGILAVAMMRQR